MMESIFYSSPTFLLIGTSILAGYGFYYKVDWFFYPYAILFVFLPFVFSSAILGVLILILLIQIAGKIGTRWTISILVTSYILILFGFFRSVNPKNLVNEVMKYYPHLDFNLSFLDPSYIIFLPNHWFSESLYWFTKSEFSLAFKYSLLLNLLFVFLLIVSLLVGTKLYRKSFLVSLDLKSKKEIQKYYQRMFPSSERILDFRKSSIFDTQTEVLLKKEFHQFFRDPSQWIHLSVIVFLISIFIASIARVDLLNALPFLQTITYLSIFIFNSFLISSITLRFIYPVLSIEAQSFWKIKSSPIKPEKLILVKFLPIFLITLLIAESLNFFSHLSDSIPKILKTYSTINIFSISLTLAALNFWFGSYFISFTEKNPVKIASSQGATIAFLFNMIYLIFLVIILFYPVNEVFSKKAINVQVSQIGFLVSSVVLLIISLVVSFFAYRSGKKSLAEDY
jgi:ABC-2 type transport system permease protein